MENQEIQFADGMNFKNRHDKAPESVRGSIYFETSKFKKFLDANTDSRGYVNVKMMKSMTKGTIYFILDTWKPKSDPQATQEYNDQKYRIPQHAEKDRVNVEVAEKLFGQPLTEEEQFNLSNVPF